MKIDGVILERSFKALANRRRLAILRALQTRKRLSVGDVAREIKLSIKATSKHLGLLYAAGLVDKEQESLIVYYFVRKDLPVPFGAIISHL